MFSHQPLDFEFYGMDIKHGVIDDADSLIEEEEREELAEELKLSCTNVMLQCLDAQILQFQPKELTFKIMRDTRFSNDKSPYNPAHPMTT